MPVTVKIRLYATFKLIAGQNKFELILPDDVRVIEAVHALLNTVPVLQPHWLNQQGELHAHVHTFLNEVDISTLQSGLETRIRDGDLLEFIPPVAGG